MSGDANHSSGTDVHLFLVGDLASVMGLLIDHPALTALFILEDVGLQRSPKTLGRWFLGTWSFLLTAFSFYWLDINKTITVSTSTSQLQIKPP